MDFKCGGTRCNYYIEWNLTESLCPYDVQLECSNSGRYNLYYVNRCDAGYCDQFFHDGLGTTVDMCDVRYKYPEHQFIYNGWDYPHTDNQFGVRNQHRRTQRYKRPSQSTSRSAIYGNLYCQKFPHHRSESH